MTDAERIADHARAHLALEDAQLAPEYGYRHLPLCVLDAVFSINARYEAVQNVVRRYAQAVGLHADFQQSGGRMLEAGEEEHTIPEMAAFIERVGVETFAEDIVRNRQRTSPRNGILKADAALRVARMLNEHGIHRMGDVQAVRDANAFETSFRAIPGQGSGTWLKYFYMLSGADDLIKPDRMILGYMNQVLGRTPTTEEAQTIIAEACDLLGQAGYSRMSPRLLDNLIWNYQRR
jgi:hypothetical protein